MFSINPNDLLTVRELEFALRKSGDMSPKLTMRRLQARGLTVHAGKLIRGDELLAVMSTPTPAPTDETDQGRAS